MDVDSALPANCVLCDAPLPGTAQGPFCRAHLVVPGEDRRSLLPPPVLSRHEEGDWSLFLALRHAGGGHLGEGLVGDWLAVYRPTGAVRWFPWSEETTVWLTLLREPPQEQSAPRPPGWGAFVGPFHSETQILLSVPDSQPDPVSGALAEQVAATPLPLYGPPAGLYGLHFRSHSAARHDGGPLLITGLEFADWPAANADPARTARALAKQQRVLGKSPGQRRLTSWWLNWLPDPYLPARNAPPVPTQALHCHTQYTLAYDSALFPFEHDDDNGWWQMRTQHDPISPRLFAGLPAPVVAQLGIPLGHRLCLHIYSLLYSYAPDRLDAIVAAPVEVHERPLTIAGAEFRGTFLAWGGPYPLVAFTLARPEAGPVGLCLEGAAYGIPLTELVSLLEQLVIINDQPDLVTQYMQDYRGSG